MGAVREHRRLLAWVALVALFGNVLAGIICPLPLKAGPSDYATDLLGPLVICSHAGNEIVPDNRATPDEPGKRCPLCITFSALNHIVVPTSPALDFRPVASEPVEFAAAAGVVTPAERGGLRSRGPPLQA